MATIIVSSSVWNRIYEYYENVETKYSNTWDINDTIEQINKIQWVISNFESVCVWSREPIILYWKRMGWKETWHRSSPWHFAFECKRVDEQDYIFIQDAEHQDDIKESCFNTKGKIIEIKQYNTMKNTRNKVRLTESQLHNVIKESVKKILSEVFLSPSDDEMSHLNMDKNTYVHDSYDTIADSDGPLHMDDISSSEKSNVSITILKPFKYNQGSGSGSYDTSSSGEEVIILPNQTIELSAHNEKNWGAIHTWYQGMAKCAHRHTFYAHGRDSEYNRGVGNTKLIMRGYSTLINGEKKGFFRINQ